MDPIVLFFILGVIARVGKSDLRLPEALYEALSIFLLLAIGLKGGAELVHHPIGTLLPQALCTVLLGFSLPFLAFPVLRKLGKLGKADSASIAAHYGSVSVVTFAVAQNLLIHKGIASESYMPLFVALLEAPGIVAGILLARLDRLNQVRWKDLAHEVLFGKSIILLAGGLLIGAIAGQIGLAAIKPLFSDLFKGVLALFLLEMGLVAGSRLADLKRAGLFLLAFGVIVPIIFASLGMLLGTALGLSLGGTALLATLAGSASYIAAPTAMRVAIPEANPTLSIGAVLGITFPFNITLGIPLYLAMAQWVHG